MQTDELITKLAALRKEHTELAATRDAALMAYNKHVADALQCSKDIDTLVESILRRDPQTFFNGHISRARTLGHLALIKLQYTSPEELLKVDWHIIDPEFVTRMELVYPYLPKVFGNEPYRVEFEGYVSEHPEWKNKGVDLYFEVSTVFTRNVNKTTGQVTWSK